MGQRPTAGVVIGMDPHKRSVTIEVMSADEAVVHRGRYATDGAGFAALLDQARSWPTRVWAVEGCDGIGRHVATRLVAAGEQVLDMPPKLSARVRTFATGQGRKTDATDAHSVALGGTTPVRPRLPSAPRRPHPWRSDGPGKATGQRLWLQRDRLTTPHRHFEQATSRTRHHPAYDRPPKAS